MLVMWRPAAGHAPPTPIAAPPLRVKANQLVDSTGAVFVLRGVSMPGLEAVSPTAADLANVRAMTGFTFRVMRQRWNMNAVRLPVSAAVWKRDGPGYLDRMAAVVALANAEGLVVVLAAQEDGSLPSPALVDFWKACAGAFGRHGGYSAGSAGAAGGAETGERAGGSAVRGRGSGPGGVLAGERADTGRFPGRRSGLRGSECGRGGKPDRGDVLAEVIRIACYGSVDRRKRLSHAGARGLAPLWGRRFRLPTHCFSASGWQSCLFLSLDGF
jgi:hypothetical protein